METKRKAFHHLEIYSRVTCGSYSPTMPELPEVEVARRAIEENCLGKRIKKLTVTDDPKVIDGVSPSDFEASIVGKRIVAAHRKGKNMWLQLDSPPFPSFQFGMAGALYIKGVAVTKYKLLAVKDEDEWPSKYSKFFVELDDGLEFSFTDKRRFAKVRLLDDPVSVPPISELGPDALLEPMAADEFWNSLSKKKIGMKALLLDQSFISGIGNWMADEVLHQARIHPLQSASSMSKENCSTLVKCINEVIINSVEVGADSSQFPSDWIFHSREKKPGKAFVNGKKIEFITAGGMTTAYMPDLQKLCGDQAVKDAERSSQFCMEETLLNTEKVSDSVGSDNAPEISDEKTAFVGKSGILEGDPSDGANEFVVPAIGMEFESYEDAYNYYNCYARESGFSVRVKNSWFKRNSREKYGAVLCCSSQGFKRAKYVNRLRKETRTGCPAMMRMRLVDSKRWRILEITLEHNHLLGAKGYKCSKKMGSELKKNLMSNSDLEVHPVKLYRTVVIDAGGDGMTNFSQTVVKESSYRPTQLNLRKGDAQAMYNYLCRMQLTNSNFFYVMDLNDDGRLRNVIWVDAKSRAASSYFGDVIYFDNTCLSNKYEVPLVAFVGLNHHGQSVLLGCGLLSGENKESYTWLFKAWISCTSVNSPETIITDRCKILQSVVADVFPKSLHRFSLFLIMQKIPEKLGGLPNYDAIKKSLLKGVYETVKPFDFETAWRFMIQQFRITDNEWLWSLYEDRAQWATVYLKDTFFMGMATARPCETITAFFDKYVHKQTPLKEFLDKYELALQKKHKEEVLADMESRSSSPELKTRCSFELQLSKVYTRDIFRKFQLEVEEMYSCFGTTQLHVDGPITIFLVKERITCEGNRREVRDYEVLYNLAMTEVRCICCCFNFYGYLCRHALCVLNFNGVEEIPSKYILSRWKKEYKRLCMSPDQMSGGSDIAERVQQFTQLYRSALRVVEEGMVSLDHYKAALLAFEESLDRIYSVEEKCGE